MKELKSRALQTTGHSHFGAHQGVNKDRWRVVFLLEKPRTLIQIAAALLTISVTSGIEMTFLCFPLLILTVGRILQPHCEEQIRYRHGRGMRRSPTAALPDSVWGH